MRMVFIAALLSGCTAGTIEGYGLEGKEVSMPLFLMPLCVIFCQGAITTSGTKATTTGTGATGGSQSSSQAITNSSATTKN